VPTVEVQVATTLAAQHLSGETVEEDGEITFWLCDEEDAVELNHEIGDPEKAAERLEATARAMLEHAERIRYRVRMRTAGWT